MSQSNRNRTIGVDLAEWMVKAPLLPQEKAEIERLCLIQDQAEAAKERVVAQAQLRVAIARQTLN